MRQVIVRVLALCSQIGLLVVWPFEFCLGLFVRLVVGGVTRVENADAFLSRLVWWLLAPFRWLWFLCGRFLVFLRVYLIRPLEELVNRIIQGLFGAVETVDDRVSIFARVRWLLVARWHKCQETFTESSGSVRLLWAVVAVPFTVSGYLFSRMLHAFIRTAELLNLDGAVAFLVYWTRPLWYPVASLSGFGWSWFVTRNRWQLIWGFPLLLALLPAGLLLAHEVLWGQSRTADLYRTAIAKAREAKTFDRLPLYEKKLAQLGVDIEATTFNTAIQLAHDGKFEDAYQRMSSIAPADYPGYANGHIWIIQQILLDHIKLSPEKGNALIDAHFHQLAALGIKHAEIGLLQAVWLIRRNKLAEATDLLAPLTLSQPFAAIERMRLNLALKRIGEARKDAALVEGFMEQSKRGGRALTSDDYQAWCEAEDILLHNARLEAVLAEWLERDPLNKDSREMLSRLRVQRITQLLDDAAVNSEELVVSIRQLFSDGDISPEARRQIFELYRKRSENLGLKKAFDQLVQASDLPPSLADVLGTAAAAGEDWATAEPILQQVVQQLPNNSAAWNNLAYVLLKRNGDLQRALAAATAAVKSDEDNFHFRETRGQILLKLGRWQDAIYDLEFAVNGIPDAPGIHDALAKAYEAIGNPELAASHARNSQ